MGREARLRAASAPQRRDNLGATVRALRVHYDFLASAGHHHDLILAHLALAQAACDATYGPGAALRRFGLRQTPFYNPVTSLPN